MAFTFAYSISDEEMVIKDFPTATGVTPARGDVVILNGSGQIAAAGNNPTTVLGVYEGGSFTGLVPSGMYAAAAANVNDETNTTNPLGKVRLSATSVYRVPYTGTAPVVGTKYGNTSGQAPAGAQARIDTANTTTGAIYQVIAVDTANSNAFVVITAAARQLAF